MNSKAVGMDPLSAQTVWLANAPEPEIDDETQCRWCSNDTATVRCCGWPKDDERQDYDR